MSQKQHEAYSDNLARGLGGHFGPPTSTVNQDGIMNQIQVLQTQLRNLHDSIGRLEERLVHVLSPIGPSPGGVNDKSAKYLPSTVEQELEGLSNGMCAASAMLDDICSRTRL